MSKNKIIDGLLWLLLVLGFLGALKVSYANWTGSPCPYISFVPVCYVVLVAYGLMILSVLIRHNGCKHYSFCIGWGVATVIALLGTVAEVTAGGGICPTTGGGSVRGVSSGSLPLCYVSLAMLIAILILFLAGPYQRACHVYNQNQDR